MNILFTGFEPFGGLDYNPSWDAAQAAAEEIDAVAELLPVTFEAARDIAESDYELAVHFGVAASRTHVCLERFAHNWRSPDVRGHDAAAAHPVRIIEGGPPALECAAQLDALAATLNRAGGFDWRVSHDAGTYVCNATLYHALLVRGPQRVMFVHIPMMGADVARQIGRAFGVATRGHKVVASAY